MRHVYIIKRLSYPSKCAASWSPCWRMCVPSSRDLNLLSANIIDFARNVSLSKKRERE